MYSYKWSEVIHYIQSAQISQKRDGRNVYVQSWKQGVLPVITAKSLWQLKHLGTWCTWCTSCPQVHELPQKDCGDNREGTLFSWLNIYLNIYVYLYNIMEYIYIYIYIYITYLFFSPLKPCNTKNGQDAQYSPSQMDGTRWIPLLFYILLQAVQSNSRLC